MSRDAEITTPGAASPFDWYVEPVWATEALIKAEASLGILDWGIVWDPACGMGNILRAFELWPRLSSDVQFRGFSVGGLFFEVDFVGPIEALNPVLRETPRFGRSPISIVSNPPFSYIKGISEAFVRRALAVATRKVAMLLPVKWQASQTRHKLFAEFPPSRIWVLSERPSMPPGALIADLGDDAFKHGKVDYMWVVWDVKTPASVTEWRTIAPRAKVARA